MAAFSARTSRTVSCSASSDKAYNACSSPWRQSFRWSASVFCVLPAVACQLSRRVY
jgi:hypothetical protein